jgi:hypothetical protein
LVTENTAAIICFKDGMAISIPHELRGLFVRFTLEGFPTMLIFQKQQYRTEKSLSWSI